MILNKQRFEDAYKQLRDKAYKNGDKEPSFMTGFWYAQEGYKYGIWEDARKDMALISWPDHKDDTKYILQMASQPFGIISRDEKKQQNLVSPQNYGKLLLHVFDGSEKIRKEAADALYSLYYGKDEQEAFERITKLLKGLPDPISVVSFY
ncbi:MAG: hypothetical protein Q4D71_14080, partial [Oscillospiraceae bacterium]|nr:hypothetical protein [Oscillospiraceae bacterium]